jgi:hypothetical protein
MIQPKLRLYLQETFTFPFFERVQAMLGAHHFVPVRLQCGDQLLEA